MEKDDKGQVPVVQMIGTAIQPWGPNGSFFQADDGVGWPSLFTVAGNGVQPLPWNGVYADQATHDNMVAYVISAYPQ
jgi:hypothetical protein